MVKVLVEVTLNETWSVTRCTSIKLGALLDTASVAVIGVHVFRSGSPCSTWVPVPLYHTLILTLGPPLRGLTNES